MGCNPESGHIRELMSEKELLPQEILFNHGEIINIKGCDFKVIQIVGTPHNTITFQSIGIADKVKKLMSEFIELK